jgi:hypothetical protein
VNRLSRKRGTSHDQQGTNVIESYQPAQSVPIRDLLAPLRSDNADREADQTEMATNTNTPGPQIIRKYLRSHPFNISFTLLINLLFFREEITPLNGEQISLRCTGDGVRIATCRLTPDYNAILSCISHRISSSAQSGRMFPRNLSDVSQ